MLQVQRRNGPRRKIADMLVVQDIVPTSGDYRKFAQPDAISEPIVTHLPAFEDQEDPM